MRMNDKYLTIDSMKSKLKRFFFGSSFNKRTINQWSLNQFSIYEKKLISLSHFCDTTPKNSDIIECGVGCGKGTQLLASISYSQNRSYYAFDTFSGFPDGVEEDNFFKSDSREVFSCFNVAYIKDQLKNVGVSSEVINSINFREGLFSETFKSYSGNPGFVFADVDLYQSYKECLEFFFPKLVKNGVILFDEYDSKKSLKKWPGAKIAIDEFVEKHNIEIKKLWTGAVYIQKLS